MLSDEVEVELDTPAGAFGQLEMAIDDFGVGAAGLFDVLIGEVVEVLEDFAVSQREHEMQSGHGGDDSANVVRRYHDVVGLSGGGDLLEFEDSTALSHIGLDDVDDAHREQVAILVG